MYSGNYAIGLQKTFFLFSEKSRFPIESVSHHKRFKYIKSW
ncbi:hypothetical protein HMPREF6123_2598 [Oribacterium sinus F0268]|uniref:Uncharacterized protein n=1 Tax=Oribacterium sinus F0268 TaxID=585501 RepID=C2L1H9_9FIRM|nr:hypothetical protein HMPREF6123_2598 [Oribacterium sinus F0268]